MAGPYLAAADMSPTRRNAGANSGRCVSGLSVARRRHAALGLAHHDAVPASSPITRTTMPLMPMGAGRQDAGRGRSVLSAISAQLCLIAIGMMTRYASPRPQAFSRPRYHRPMPMRCFAEIKCQLELPYIPRAPLDDAPALVARNAVATRYVDSVTETGYSAAARAPLLPPSSLTLCRSGRLTLWRPFPSPVRLPRRQSLAVVLI